MATSTANCIAPLTTACTNNNGLACASSFIVILSTTHLLGTHSASSVPSPCRRVPYTVT